MTAYVPAVAACLLAAGAPEAKPVAPVTDIAADAYVYGYPLVLMKFTREQAWAYGYQANCFHHDRELKDADDKGVVRQNTDNLYSSAFLDLTAQPLVLHVPDTTGRYYLLQLLDAWTNTFSSPGSRTTGTAAQDFILAGPEWRGPLPGNTPVIRSSTSLGWIIGRTEVKHYLDPAEQEAELDAVHAIQDQYTLTPLSEWRQGNPSPCLPPAPGALLAQTPLQRLQSLSAVEFLQVLSDLMQQSPAAVWDRPTLKRFEAIGFYPGRSFNPPASMQADINAAKAVAGARIEVQWRALATLVNGWGMVLTEIGTFQTDYLKRAAVARHGLGANLLADAIYPTAYLDMNGVPLGVASRSYRIHFAAGQTPPVQGFWSITLYKGDYFFDNALDRYAIHGTDPLKYNADGSLDLYVQTVAPVDPDLLANWLPAPPAPFNMTLRMYWPDKTAIEGRWAPPPIEPL
jgi:hypothetical protein